ncbi:hypothetical protein [Saccharopolyspora endophytica]|uniref:Uncharacterized protein n=1 Tax=Saccharopolyspora endophytica TaxID=543886 RepID=A0ABS5DMN9_9PSEU|nr:hypothetical protein [Saccharopolyspora endophytica]MBQ0927554.1 hypothetical protein [Saccharopolyspora endophytica]
MTISDSVLSVAALLRTGDLRAARAQWRETLTSADAREISALAECGRILAEHPRTGVKRLREYWKRADERDRAVIAACAPRPGEQRERPEPQADRASRWDRQAIENARRRAGGAVRTEVRPELRRAQRKARAEARAVTEYAATRAGVDDAPQRGERPDGYAVDYERMAINPVARDRERPDPRTTAVRDGGRPCVALGCNIEPSRADRAHRDGLCQECRELGRPGIQVPDNATRAQAIEALCAYIHQHYPRALKHLRTEWSRYSHQTDRDTVAAWAAANASEPAEQPAAPELAACQTCGEDRSPRDVRHLPADDGQCAGCRALESAPALSVVPSAADDAPAAAAEPAALAA